MSDSVRLPFVRTIEHHPEVASTNDLARERLADPGVALPLLIRADRQTAGRGRGGNSWWSAEGSLILTLGIDPAVHRLRAEHEPCVALTVATAVVGVVEEILGGPSPRDLGIRWPNDVEAGGRKFCGLLTERIETPTGPRLAVGVGINVNNDMSRAPEGVRAMAVSLAEIVRRPGLDLEFVTAALLRQAEACLDALADDDRVLPAAWARLDLLRDAPIRVDLGDRVADGIARGILPDGSLRFENEGRIVNLRGGRILREGAR